MKQLRIVAAALGVVALWWIVWRTVDSGSAPVAEDVPSEPVSEAETAPPPESPDLQERAREALGTPAASQAAEAPVVEPPGPRVRLEVLLEDARDQAPVANATLRLFDSGWEVRTARSEGLGGYEFLDLAPGTWEIAVEAAGYRSVRQSLELTAEELDRRLVLPLEVGDVVKMKLVGQAGLEIRDVSWRTRMGLGEEAAWLEPVVTVEEPTDWLSTPERGKPGDAGIFVERRSRPDDPLRDRVRLFDGGTIDDLPAGYAGVFLLSKPPPVFASLVIRGFAIQTVPVLPGADEVTFGFAKEDYAKLAGSVKLRVLDGDTSSPPASMRVQLGQRLAGRRGSPRDPDGTIVFEEVLVGNAVLLITADDRELVHEHVRVRAGGVTDLGVYRLQPLSSVRARVLDDAGEPAQVMFNVFPFDRYAATREALAKRIFRSSPDGVLTIDTTGRGRHLILANEAGWVSMPVVADTTLGDVEDLEIRVSRGTRVAVRLRADPLPATRLEIRTRSGLPVAERKCRDRDPMEFLLVPGSYSLELWDGEAWLASETLTVASDPVRMFFPR